MTGAGSNKDKCGRKPLRPSTRFEIFKRDGFKCRYCGCTPVQSVLRVDHVIPVVDGGTDDAANLVTACFECNAGKGAGRLDETLLPPTPSLADLQDQVAQIRQYLEMNRLIEAERAAIRDDIAVAWEQQIGPMSEQMYRRLAGIVQKDPHAMVVKAIGITARKLSSVGSEYEWAMALRQQKYFSVVLRSLKQERGQ